MSGIFETPTNGSGSAGGTGLTPAQLQALENAVLKTENTNIVDLATQFRSLQVINAPTQATDVMRLGDINKRSPKLFTFRVRWDLVPLDAGQTTNGSRTYTLPIKFLRDRGLKMERYNMPHLMRMSVHSNNGGGSAFYGTYQGGGFTGPPPYGYRSDTYWSTINAPQYGWGAGRFTVPAKPNDYLPPYDPNNATVFRLHTESALVCRWTGELYTGLWTYHVLEIWDDDFLAFGATNDTDGFPINPAFE